MYFELVLFSYFIDYLFGEFEKLKYLKHPIIIIGNYIKWFEDKFYADCLLRGFFLTFSLLIIVYFVTSLLSLIDNIFFQALICSFAISSKMLYDSVKEIVISQNPKEALSMLVSRDTKKLSDSEVNKAAIETYAENLSDGVIAPIFYMLLFGVVGAFMYKAINTLDSMVGYRNKKYEKFGKVSARVDDIANFIPSRITALLIAILLKSKLAFKKFSLYGKKHESLNAGYPISAMALALNLKLGGPTSYFGKIKEKAFFGEGKKLITKEDVLNALKFKSKFDFLMLILLILTIFTYIF